jgi:hypothetical protein
MICLSGIEGKEYEALFLKAVDEWKSRWGYFSYTLSRASGCHINVSIVKTHVMFDKNNEIGYTNLEYWERGSITNANIILPTHKKITIVNEVNGKTVTNEVLQPLSKVQFYRAALHEFGHALNLGHFDDNGYEPIDIMYAYPAEDDQEQGISQRDIAALNWLYRGVFENDVTVRADKKYYRPGDAAVLLGEVKKVIVGEDVTLEILDQNKQLYTSETVKVSQSGTFNYKFRIAEEMQSGTYRIKAIYNNILADGWFDVNNPNPKETEMSFATEGMTAPILPLERRVTVVETMFVDHTGSKVSSIHSQEQVFLQSSFVSSFPQIEATYIVQIKNSEGETIEISSGTYNLVSGASKLSQSWLPPELGEYSIDLFLWKSISNPEPLISKPVHLKAVVV